VNFLPVILILSILGAVWWVFSTFALMDIFTAAFVIVAVICLGIATFAILSPRGAS
jgi:hypothetical protein